MKFLCYFFCFSAIKDVTLHKSWRKRDMILKNISIINYKNVRAANLDFSSKINCFIGHNGEGKTNVLDAIYYLSFCRSCTNPTDSQLINHNEDFMMLDGNYLDDDDNPENVTCGLKRGQKKHFKRNKKEYKRLSQHIGFIPLVIVSPADSALIDSGSDARRHFMDLVISQFDHSYIEALNSYNKALQQRNALLKMEDEPDAALMEIWEEQMAMNGEAVYEKRRAFIEEFIPIFQKIYEKVSGGKEQVTLNYTSHCQRGPLLEVIQRDRHKDRAVGYSLHGIHRDELEMLLEGFQIKREGSQGQNKTFVLAMKLAQFNFLRRTLSATTPLLLLDDIFDKLDASRVENIISLVSGDEFGQIFITDTNREHLDRILSTSKFGYKLFNVKAGDVQEEG